MVSYDVRTEMTPVRLPLRPGWRTMLAMSRTCRLPLFLTIFLALGACDLIGMGDSEPVAQEVAEQADQLSDQAGKMAGTAGRAAEKAVQLKEIYDELKKRAVALSKRAQAMNK